MISSLTMDTKRETQLRLRVLKKIQQHTSANPVKYDVIALEFNTSWRKIASCVEDLRDAGWKIASTNSAPHGCFLAQTPAELRPTVIRMADQAKKILIRVAKMKDWSDSEPKIFEGAEFGMDLIKEVGVAKAETVEVHCVCGYVSSPSRTRLKAAGNQMITCNGDVDKPCGRKFRASSVLMHEKDGVVSLENISEEQNV